MNAPFLYGDMDIRTELAPLEITPYAEGGGEVNRYRMSVAGKCQHPDWLPADYQAIFGVPESGFGGYYTELSNDSNYSCAQYWDLMTEQTISPEKLFVRRYPIESSKTLVNMSRGVTIDFAPVLDYVSDALYNSIEFASFGSPAFIDGMMRSSGAPLKQTLKDRATTPTWPLYGIWDYQLGEIVISVPGSGIGTFSLKIMANYYDIETSFLRHEYTTTYLHSAGSWLCVERVRFNRLYLMAGSSVEGIEQVDGTRVKYDKWAITDSLPEFTVNFGGDYFPQGRGVYIPVTFTYWNDLDYFDEAKAQATNRRNRAPKVSADVLEFFPYNEAVTLRPHCTSPVNFDVVGNDSGIVDASENPGLNVVEPAWGNRSNIPLCNYTLPLTEFLK